MLLSGSIIPCERATVDPDGAVSAVRLIHQLQAPAFPARFEGTVLIQARGYAGAPVAVRVERGVHREVVPVALPVKPDRVALKALKLEQFLIPDEGDVSLVLTVAGTDVARWDGRAMFIGMGALPMPRSTAAYAPLQPPPWLAEFASRRRCGMPDLGARRLHWLGYWDAATGYGQMSHRTVAELMARGWQVAVHRMPWDHHVAPVGALEGPSRAPGWADALVAAVLPTDLYAAPSASWVACWTMWEAFGLRPWWREALGACDDVWVPSPWCEGRLVVEGVTASSAVVPVPVDASAFAGLSGPPALGHAVRFLFHSSAIKRKGLDVLCRAWRAAFPRGDEVVEMVVLARYEGGVRGCAEVVKALEDLAADDPRVTALCDALPEAEMLDAYRAAHCMVLPSRGEGFGMTVAQAMCAGLLVIAPSHTGLSSLVGPATALVLRDSGLAEGEGYYEGTSWLDPDEAHLVELLREVATAGPGLWERTGVAKALASNFCIEHAVDALEERLMMAEEGAERAH